jgi:hypothetical protein
MCNQVQNIAAPELRGGHVVAQRQVFQTLAHVVKVDGGDSQSTIEIEEDGLKGGQHIGFPLRVDGETPSSWKMRLQQAYSNGITVDAQVKKPGAADWTLAADIWYIWDTIYVS